VEKSTSQEGVADELIKLGYRSTPVIVKGDKVIVGYSPAKLAQALL